MHNVPVLFLAKGPLDVDRLAAAFERVILRHPVLNSVFALDDQGLLSQRPADKPEPHVLRVPGALSRAAALRAAAAVATRPFDLSRGPLAGLLIAEFSEPALGHVIQLTFHHLVVDGKAVEVLLEQLSAEYAGTPLTASERTSDFGSYAIWQASPDGACEIVRHEQYWRGLLRGRRRPLWPEPEGEDGAGGLRGAAVEQWSAGALTAQVLSAASALGVTPFSVTAAAFTAVVHGLTGVPDFVMGTPSLGRRHSAVQQTVGVFSDALALRCRWSGRESFGDCVMRMRQAVIDAQVHDPLPVAELAGLLSAAPAVGARAGFDVWFALDPNLGAALRMPGVEIAELVPAIVTSKFALQANVRLDPACRPGLSCPASWAR